VAPWGTSPKKEAHLRKTIIFCVFFLGVSAAAYCGQASRIEFTDGSVINGEIVSLANGIYTINAPSVGQLTVEAARVSKIESLRPPSADSTGQSNGISQSQINAYKDKVMSNPESMAVIKGLADNPQIQDIAKDPEILNAAKSGDIQGLMNSEKFKQLISNPEIQKAVKKLKQ